MAKGEFRLKASEMRKAGKSIRAIASALGVSRGTASTWCRDIELTPEQREMLKRSQIAAGNQGRMKGAEMNKRKRLENMAEQALRARKAVGRLSERDRLMIGLALYWGEGTKTRNGATALINSDPAVVRMARDWFEQLGVEREMFTPRIFVSGAHRAREVALMTFWSKILEISPAQFGKTVFLRKRGKKVYENHDSYYGVLALRVRRGTTLRYHILGLIEACKESAGVAQVVRAQHS